MQNTEHVPTAFEIHDYETHDLIVFSHLRWDFVFQRPQHLLSRFAKHRRVYFFEEPLLKEDSTAFLQIRENDEGVTVVQPYLPKNLAPAEISHILESQVHRLISDEQIDEYSLWYYTPMALRFSKGLTPKTIIYDCMDELSHFKNAPPELLAYEYDLFKKADLVFTGGHSLFEAKRDFHPNIHPMPSSIDFHHFSKARATATQREDQIGIPSPRLGFFGVIDERMDLKLLESVARARPDWNLVMIGPVVKIDETDLPRLPNIHYLGKKDYQELPAYLGGWDVAMLPFALNDSTKFISPTKTPEYLAAGCPVVSTPIRDVVRPYGENGLVSIASTPEEFIKAVEEILNAEKLNSEWLSKVDEFLADQSWDHTWHKMAILEKSLACPVRRAEVRSSISEVYQAV